TYLAPRTFWALQVEDGFLLLLPLAFSVLLLPPWKARGLVLNSFGNFRFYVVEASILFHVMVTAIMESKDLDSMALATLFSKQQDHEMELGRLNLHEESDKVKKGISLRASTSQDQEDRDDD
ncbi:hypothetical protein Lal_00032186, partial [Lupinus albus]